MAEGTMVRHLMSSEWTAAALGVVILLAHAVWFQTSSHQSEVLSGLGGSVTVLGIFVAAQPYIRKGVRQAGREQAGLENHGEEEEGVQHVLKERVIGVALIGLGSLLNGYGPAIAGVLGLRGT